MFGHTFAMAACRRFLDPGNQFPNALCMLYARSKPIKTPVGDGYRDILSVV